MADIVERVITTTRLLESASNILLEVLAYPAVDTSLLKNAKIFSIDELGFSTRFIVKFVWFCSQCILMYMFLSQSRQISHYCSHPKQIRPTAITFRSLKMTERVILKRLTSSVIALDDLFQFAHEPNKHIL